MKTTSGVSFWQWAVVFGAMAAAIGITEKIGVSQKWQDVAVFTTILFSTVALMLKRFWRFGSFWVWLFLLLAVHLSVLEMVLKSIQIGRFGIPGLVMTAITFMEAIVMAALIPKFVRAATEHRNS